MRSKSSSAAAVALILSGLSLSALAAAPPLALLGDPAPAAMSSRTIAIQADTKYVNVTGGDTVTFSVDGKSFAWNFDVPMTVTSFDLNRVAPQGLLNHPIRVYVETNPRYKHSQLQTINN